VLAGDAVYREWMYVSLGRARRRTLVVATTDDLRDGTKRGMSRLQALVERSQAQTMAIEHAPVDEIRTLLTEAVGPRPAMPADALKWDRALAAVTAYRQARPERVLDALIGDAPSDQALRLRWLLAHRAVRRAERAGDRRLEREA
jgi:hypothetical protein